MLYGPLEGLWQRENISAKIMTFSCNDTLLIYDHCAESADSLLSFRARTQQHEMSLPLTALFIASSIASTGGQFDSLTRRIREEIDDRKLEEVSSNIFNDYTLLQRSSAIKQSHDGGTSSTTRLTMNSVCCGISCTATTKACVLCTMRAMW